MWGASMGYERPLYFHKSQDESYGGVSPGGVVEHTLYGDVVRSLVLGQRCGVCSYELLCSLSTH